MGKAVIVSLGRVVADQVRVDAPEAFAVTQQLWQRIRATRDDDGAMIPFPALDEIGITPMGDFELRKTAAERSRSPYPPHRAAHDLGSLLLRLLSSGRRELDGVPAACVDAGRRASSRNLPGGVRPLVTPEALLTAIEAYRPRDPSLALAGLYARWIRTTDRAHAGPWEAMVAAHPGLAGRHADIGVPRAAPAREPITAAPPRVPAPATRDAAPVSVSQHAAGRSAPPDVTQARRRRASGWPVAGLAALVLLVLLGAAAWRWARVSPSGDIVERDDAVQASPSDGTIPAPRAAPAPSLTEVEVTASRTRPSAPAAPVRVRRLLAADTTGRAPYSPSFDPRTNALVFHAGIQHSALLQASLGRDGAVDAISTMSEDGSRSYHPQVSPDGEHIAYDSDSLGTRGVYIANRDGSSPRRVSGPGYASVPTWSPDGQYVAFARAEPHRPRVWNVWTVHVPTGELRRHTSHRVGQPWGASWFPDGQRIAYSLEERLIVRDLETGASHSYPTPLPGRLVRTPAVAPDGQRIVFQVYRDGAWLLDLRTGQSQRLLADAHAEEFAWSPDGRRVAYHSSRGGERGIWVLDMEQEP